MGRALLLLLAIAGAPPVRAEPLRVVSLAPSVTETVFALGLGERLVGVSLYCDYPAAAARIDRVGTFLAPNVEAIVAKRPDLVIVVPSPGNQNPVQSLKRLGLEVLVVDPHTVAEIERSILDIARALGHEEKGRALVGRIEVQMNEVRQRLAGAPRRKVLMVIGHNPLVAVGSGTFPHELIEMAGGVNLAAPAGGGWPHLSIEFAIAAAPEVIIDTSMGNEEGSGAEGAMAFWKSFPSIPAVRERRIFGYKAYELLRPGPRIADALVSIARFIHPERMNGDALPAGAATPAPASGRERCGRVDESQPDR